MLTYFGIKCLHITWLRLASSIKNNLFSDQPKILQHKRRRKHKDGLQMVNLVGGATSGLCNIKHSR